jgi:hypothetical protein
MGESEGPPPFACIAAGEVEQPVEAALGEPAVDPPARVSPGSVEAA